MRLLLDTDALLWWLGDDDALSENARAAIGLPENEVAVSVASVLEIESARAAGDLEMPEEWLDELEPDFTVLAIGLEHAALAAALPPHHADLIDRLLVAQAQIEGYAVVTREPSIGRYQVPTLPA